MIMSQKNFTQIVMSVTNDTDKQLGSKDYIIIKVTSMC